MLAAPGCLPHPHALFVGRDPAPTRIGGGFVPFSARTSTRDEVDHTVVFVAPVSGVAPVKAMAASATSGPRAPEATLRADAAAPLVHPPEPSWRLAASALLTLGRRMRR